MDTFQDSSSSFSCELRIVRARNVELNSMGGLFVRCYMSAGKNKRVRLESQEVSPTNMVWNQSFNLDCFGTKDSVSTMLCNETVMIELRRRKRVSVFGRSQSQLLGKAEVSWRSVFESSTMEIENWVVMKSRKNGGMPDDVKPPAVQIGMKVGGVPVVGVKESGGKTRGCSCKSCVNCELFALDAALEGLLF